MSVRKKQAVSLWNRTYNTYATVRSNAHRNTAGCSSYLEINEWFLVSEGPWLSNSFGVGFCLYSSIVVCSLLVVVILFTVIISENCPKNYYVLYWFYHFPNGMKLCSYPLSFTLWLEKNARIQRQFLVVASSVACLIICYLMVHRSDNGYFVQLPLFKKHETAKLCLPYVVLFFSCCFGVRMRGYLIPCSYIISQC